MENGAHILDTYSSSSQKAGGTLPQKLLFLKEALACQDSPLCLYHQVLSPIQVGRGPVSWLSSKLRSGTFKLENKQRGFGFRTHMSNSHSPLLLVFKHPGRGPVNLLLLRSHPQKGSWPTPDLRICCFYDKPPQTHTHTHTHTPNCNAKSIDYCVSRFCYVFAQKKSPIDPLTRWFMNFLSKSKNRTEKKIITK